MEAQLAKNPLVLEQSLESNGRKITSNLKKKNLKGEMFLFSRKRKRAKPLCALTACIIGQVKGTC